MTSDERLWRAPEPSSNPLSRGVSPATRSSRFPLSAHTPRDGHINGRPDVYGNHAKCDHAMHDGAEATRAYKSLFTSYLR